MIQTSPVAASSKITSTYIPALDGLRALAILLVLLAHYGFAGVPGGFGVTLFFFISGFLITRLLLSEVKRTGRIGLKDFYIRRLLRLYPALLFMITLSVLYMASSDCRLSVQSLLSALFYYQNYFSAYLQQTVDGQCPKFFLILWSLAVEEHFYLFYPLLFGLLWRHTKLFVIIMGLICVVALLRRIQLFYTLQDTIHAIDIAGSLTEARLDSIMYGCLVAVWLNTDYKEGFIRVVGQRWVFIMASMLLAFSILYREDFFRAAWRYVAQSVALACLIPSVLFHPAYRRLRDWLSVPLLLYIGRLSYSLYLFHWFGLCVAFDYLKIPYGDFKLGQPSFYAILSIALPLSAVATLFCFYYVERPMIALRKRFGSAGI